MSDENKRLAQLACGTLVITEFGPASANIRIDCVIRDQTETKVKTREKSRCVNRRVSR